MAILAAIPSPDQSVWHLGPFPLRAYALFILAGVAAAILIGDRRWVARGGRQGTVADIAVWAVPFGLVGGRLYHVITTPQPYFGPGGDPWQALRIWEGGLGIWGAVALGGVGAWIGCRRRGIPLPAFADVVAPGLAVAQALGRWGNYFNQELFGGPTDLPWALQIDAGRRPEGFAAYETFHPTFLYESLWNLGVAVLVIWADRGFRLGHGRAFALYVAAYTLGRGWIEALRIDEANIILGARINVWMSLLLFTAAVLYIVVSARRRPGREAILDPQGTPQDSDAQPGEDDRAVQRHAGSATECGVLRAPIPATTESPRVRYRRVVPRSLGNQAAGGRKHREEHEGGPETTQYRQAELLWGTPPESLGSQASRDEDPELGVDPYLQGPAVVPVRWPRGWRPLA